MPDPPHSPTISATTFWASIDEFHQAQQKIDNIEEAVAIIHKRIDAHQGRADTHRARTLTIVLAVAVPVAAILWGAWTEADEGNEIAQRVASEQARVAADVDALQTTQMEIREGVVELRTGQDLLRQEVRSNQSVLLDQLRELNGR